MPLVKVQKNVANVYPIQTQDRLNALSKLLAGALGKSEAYVLTL